MNATRPVPSTSQFFWGVALAGGLLCGAGVLLAIPLTIRSNELFLVFFVLTGPAMVGITTFIARRNSIAFWVGALSTLVPWLLVGLLLVISAFWAGVLSDVVQWVLEGNP